MQILPFAQKHLLKITLIFGMFFASSAILAANQPVKAAIDYGDQMCATERPLDCPAGMKVGGVGNNAITCISLKSKYCEILTGDPSYDDFNLASSAFDRCNSKVLGSRAVCEKLGTVTYLEITDQTTRNSFEQLFQGLDGNFRYDNVVEPKFERKSVGYPYLRDGISGGYTISFTCTDDLQPVIPTVDFSESNYMEGTSVISSSAKAQYINVIRESGLRLRKDVAIGVQLNTNNNYCGTASDIFNRNTNTCITGISETESMRPCVAPITDSSGNPAPAVCVKGTNSAFRTSLGNGEIINLFENDGRANNHSTNLDVDPNFNAGSANACDRTSQEVLKLRSNKGCSEYMIYDSSNYTLSKAEKYDECSRCLYGENVADRLIRADTNGNYTIKLTNGQEVTASSTDVSTLTIDNEPFFDPLPGRIYSDLGCVDTSSTPNLINTILRVALVIMGGIVIIRIIQGALTMQAGDPESFEEGRNIIISAVVGLIVLILSAAILNFLGVNILQLDSNNSGFQPFG